MMHVDDPKLCIILHFAEPSSSLNVQLAALKSSLARVKSDGNASEGMLLMNMERNGEFELVERRSSGLPTVQFYDNIRVIDDYNGFDFSCLYLTCSYLSIHSIFSDQHGPDTSMRLSSELQLDCGG